jgi:hypothetical protein
MASVSAYDWIFEVESATPDTWHTIDEITEFELDYGANNEEVDATTFADDGVYAGRAIQRGASLKLTGYSSYSAGARSTSQQRIHVLGTAVGTSSIGTIRFRYTTETSWRLWDVYVMLSGAGGGNTDLAGYEVTFMKSGAETTAGV